MLIPDNKRSKPWQTTIAAVAQVSGIALAGKHVSVALGVVFYLPRPTSVKIAKRPRPSVTPDLDKLLRTVLDALTGIAYLDDAQVVQVTALKSYADHRSPGVSITGRIITPAT
jgi:Holliday junction resolvase RusA-like endonuclease